MSNFNFERSIDKIIDIIGYEISEQIEYMLQDAFGVPSFNELSDDQVAELAEKTHDMYDNYVINEIRYLIDRREEQKGDL